ncbi:MAG: DUF3489 domain-containing protein [Candidatus Accumulibacter sp.]|uniref:DUF3489 domain-containing protein n=1 Tax=Accumulibacter sp. TaxID=2053492 RepID=UPI001AD401F9|nr:DUF3489 domain-containing protein [Accumulibacter sp.]MBN8518843.1 DUF3489 domain-containing protein [Accumulibacter sp.]MBO3712717.1 DUF3489 domain-containing protein [Accumulibacter sp.]
MTTPPSLTETQRLVLERAAEHPDGRLTGFPDGVKGGARTKVLTALASKGWITEYRGHWFLAAGAAAALERDVPPPIPTMPAVIQTDTPPMLVEEIGDEAPTDDALAARRDIDPPATAAMAIQPPRTRENSKQATVVAMLKRPEGATIAQICASTGWQSHTVRGTFAGAFKKKLGLTITSEKAPGGERVYRAD